MRVLSDPAETGAVTVCLPQDVQTEAFDWPEELFAPRTWHVDRPVPDPAALARAREVLLSARRPLIVAGGGVIYSEATEALRCVRRGDGHPRGARRRRARVPCLMTTPRRWGPSAATGTTAANALASQADVVVGIGTRWSDFTTASTDRLRARRPGSSTATSLASTPPKTPALAVVGDARTALVQLERGRRRLVRRAPPTGRSRCSLAQGMGRHRRAGLHARPPARCRRSPRSSGSVNEVSGPRDVVVCAAGSMPGDLHKLWRTRDPKGYHVEYGYSCMGYEIAGGLGAKMAAPDREVYVMVGDGSYLMMAQELVTAVQENVKLTVVLVNNHGFASIGALSEIGRGAAVRHVVPVQGPGHGPPRRRPAAARLRGQRQEPRGARPRESAPSTS